MISTGRRSPCGLAHQATSRDQRPTKLAGPVPGTPPPDEPVASGAEGQTAVDRTVFPMRRCVRDTGKVEPPPTPDLLQVHVPFAYEAIKR